MSERVIELYDDMEVPQLSKNEYTKTLNECTKYMKESYELKYKAIDQIDKLIKKDDIDNVSEIKKYIKQWSTTRAETNFVGFQDSSAQGTYGWMGGTTWWGTSTSYPVSIKNGLFGVVFGNSYAGPASGGASSNVTFRPVIWN